MVNISLSAAGLLGLFDLIFSLLYLISSVVLPITRRQAIGELGIILYVIQAIIAPSILLLVGLILFLNGWRLDPILQFAFFLLHILILYLAIKDVFIFNRLLEYNRRSR